MMVQNPPRRRRGDAARTPGQERPSEFGFEGDHLLAKGRLRDMQQAGSARDAAYVNDLDESCEASRIHSCLS
ncbi:hypothetical protein GCM10023157_12230 [Gluconacetobacter asukensis]